MTKKLGHIAFSRSSHTGRKQFATGPLDSPVAWQQLIRAISPFDRSAPTHGLACRGCSSARGSQHAVRIPLGIRRSGLPDPRSSRIGFHQAAERRRLLCISSYAYERLPVMIGTGRFLMSIRQFVDRYDRGAERRTGGHHQRACWPACGLEAGRVAGGDDDASLP